MCPQTALHMRTISNMIATVKVWASDMPTSTVEQIPSQMLPLQILLSGSIGKSPKIRFCPVGTYNTYVQIAATDITNTTHCWLATCDVCTRVSFVVTDHFCIIHKSVQYIQ